MVCGIRLSLIQARCNGSAMAFNNLADRRRIFGHRVATARIEIYFAPTLAV
jgi:hypothetical protein